MYLCYVDESGTSELTGNTSHFVLTGLSIPIWRWKECDKIVHDVKTKYGLASSEIHVAWLLRQYREQSRIPNFDAMDYRQRRSEVETWRKGELLRLQRARNPQLFKQTRKNFIQTQNYIHLNYAERQNLVKQLAQILGRWGYARLFAECIDKVHFDPSRSTHTIDEQAFEQVVSRFEQYLQFLSKKNPEQPAFGLLIHDNNQTVAKKHTTLMRKFFADGTLWTDVKCIIETPLFVDSQLTSMVQLADLCSYALRRYLENGEDELFELIFPRADRKEDTVVGIRHFSVRTCGCKICAAHKRSAVSAAPAIP